MGSPSDGRDDLTRAERLLLFLGERVVLATIGILGFLGFVLNDYIGDWLPDHWLVTALHVAVFVLIVVLLSIQHRRERRAKNQELDLSALTPPGERR